MKKITSLSAIALLLSLGIIFSCKKESGNSTLNVRMTDAPADFTAVNVDLLEVRVNMRDDSTGWITLPTIQGVYNLLNLQNGVDTLIATGSIPAGEVKEIRLVLGPNNSVVDSGVTHNLTIPSGAESGLKIKVGKKVAASAINTLIVDFDALLSIKLEGGSYKLKPVLKIKN